MEETQNIQRQKVEERFKEILQPLQEQKRTNEYAKQLEEVVEMDCRVREAESVYGECYRMVTALEKKMKNYLESWQSNSS